MENPVEGRDFIVNGQDIVAVSELGNTILSILVDTHAYPFTEFLSGLTPDSKPGRMVVNLVSYDGLMDKAREALVAYRE